MKIGITGTRHGWTHAQEWAFKGWIAAQRVTEFHHGDCKGVDAQSAKLVENLFGRECIHCHPPKDPKHRAFFGGAVMYSEEDYMVRNQNIVDHATILVVIPKERREQLRSGTWATYRKGQNALRPCYIVRPDGIITSIP